MNQTQQAIGIFDSGIGGLTVYQELKRQLPLEHFIYLGDTARFPYGTKSKETVMRYSMQNCLFLMDHGVKLIVVACNTASAFALTYLKERIKTDVLGVIEPCVQAAVRTTRNKHIGIIGTEGTIRTGVYEQAIQKLLPDAVIAARAAGLFVPIVEEGVKDPAVTSAVLDYYLGFFKDKRIDTLILGCTHYPVLKGLLQQHLGPDISIVDSAHATALAVKDLLMRLHLENKIKADLSDAIYVTDAPERVSLVAKSFLLDMLVPVVKVNLA